jgi:hypothetical protein
MQREKTIKLNKATGSIALGAAAAAVLGACAPAAGPATPAPAPELGCYPSPVNPFDVDVSIVGVPNTPGALEIHTAGTACGELTGAAPYVGAADAVAALALCEGFAPETVQAIDLAAWADPAPGLTGYFVCSPK